MTRALLGLVVPALAACSVPELSLEGKQCPCVDVGFVCDEVTNRCLATNDGGTIIDTPAATQCLPAITETELYRYTGTFDWQHEDPSWMGGAQITQTSTSAMDSYAYKTAAELTAAPDYKIISSMRQVQPGSGTPAFGIVLRAQLNAQDKMRYLCQWIPKQRELRIEVQGGGNVMTLGSVIIPGSGQVPTNVTMEASVTGSTLACCLREISAARILSAPDPNMTVMMGYPGLQTNRMSASFGSFVVLKPN
ncbi:MAG TPA: hypothetical protein VIV11_07420 [Kofleriaceae bacterium]